MENVLIWEAREMKKFMSIHGTIIIMTLISNTVPIFARMSNQAKLKALTRNMLQIISTTRLWKSQQDSSKWFHRDFGWKNKSYLIFEQAWDASQRYYTTGYPDSKPINADQEFQYFGWDNDRCWCGNTEPFYPRPMEDCENNRGYSSKIYSSINSSKYI